MTGWYSQPTRKRCSTTIDRIEDPVGDSLARASKFRAAREALTEPRFASGYLDYEGLAGRIDTLTGDFPPIGPSLLESNVFPGQGVEWVGASAAWVGRGIVTEWVTPAEPPEDLNVTDLDDPAALLPADTLGFVAASFDPNLDNWRAALKERRLSQVLPGIGAADGIGGMLPGLGGEADPQLDADASLADALDLGLELAHEMTGIDLETEFFDHLAGTAVAAIQDFDFAAVTDEPVANPVNAVVMLSYKEDGRAELDQTMTNIADLAQARAGMSPESVDVGGEAPATVFDLGPLAMFTGGETGYRPGYVLHDQYLTIGTTEAALTTAIGLQNGEGENLSAATEYREGAAVSAGWPASHRLCGRPPHRGATGGGGPGAGSGRIRSGA